MSYHSFNLAIAANAIAGRGGQGENLAQLISAAAAFTQPIVIAADRKAATRNLTSKALLAGAQVLRGLPIARRLRDYVTLLDDSAFDLAAAALADKYDVFHSISGQSLLSMRQARKRGARLLLDSTTVDVREFYRAQVAECSRFGIRPSTHPIKVQRSIAEYQEADLIRAQSPLTKQTLAERGVPAEKIRVLPPSIDVCKFHSATFTRGKFSVSFVGLLEPWKGFHYLVGAYRKLQLKDAELVMWGGSGSRPVAQYLKDSMQACPSIRTDYFLRSTSGYAKAYSTANVFVHPSVSDGFGLAVIEAMASGLPVVVTRATGASYLVREGVSGFIVDAGDADALADRIKYLYDRPEKVRQMGMEARRGVEMISPDIFSRQYLDILRELA